MLRCVVKPSPDLDLSAHAFLPIGRALLVMLAVVAVPFGLNMLWG